jgi:hypothetical protein
VDRADLGRRLDERARLENKIEALEHERAGVRSGIRSERMLAERSRRDGGGKALIEASEHDARASRLEARLELIDRVLASQRAELDALAVRPQVEKKRSKR